MGSTKGMKFGPMSAERRAKIGAANSKKVYFACDYCGQAASAKPSAYSRSKRHFCSISCRAGYVKDFVPKEEQNAFGKGNSIDERRKRAKARSILNHAVRDGIIKRDVCEVCGADNAEGHHPNYDIPLSVVWLCFKHHRDEHRKNQNENADLLKQTT